MKKGLREKFFWLVGVYVCEVYGCKSGDLVVIQWDINYGRYWFSRISFTVQEEDGGHHLHTVGVLGRELPAQNILSRDL